MGTGVRALRSQSKLHVSQGVIHEFFGEHLPGIHSARYAGDNARDSENVAKLLKMMALRSATNRKAQFQCYMVVYSPEGKEFVLNGTLKGTISDKVRGTDGFGYDPVFIPEGESKTLSELGLTRKNQISHRAEAIRKLTATFEINI